MPQLVFVGQAGTSKISRVRVVGLMKNMDETMSTFETSPNARPQASAYCRPSVWRTAQMSVTATRSARSCLNYRGSVSVASEFPFLSIFSFFCIV